MPMSKRLQEVFDRMEEVDQFVRQNGLGTILPNPNGLSRFNTAVLVRHEDGSTMFFENAYAVMEGEILMVFTEHNDYHVYHTGDLSDTMGWCMYKGVGIPEWNEETRRQGPRLKQGEKVVTQIDPKLVSDDWQNQGERRHNEEGEVVEVSDSHGLCYKVRYSDGLLGWFDPHEVRRKD